MEIHQNPLFCHENIFFLMRKSLNTPNSIFRANIRNLLLQALGYGDHTTYILRLVRALFKCFLAIQKQLPNRPQVIANQIDHR